MGRTARFRVLRPAARLGLAVVAVAALGAFPVPVGAADEPIVLEEGDAAFWSGPPPGTPSCTDEGEPCWDYRIEVLERGWRLRIAIDRPSVGDVFTATVFTPTGTPAATISPGTSLYSAEFLRSSPTPGTWRVRVTAVDVIDLRFRLRAKLEAPPPPSPKPPVPVPPNLQALPPYEFSFRLPTTNGTTPGRPEGIELPGGRVACHPEEIVLELAVRCLRMGFGVSNTGQGPMQLYYLSGPTGVDKTLFQRVRRSDGTFDDRIAGLARYHPTHVHYHHHEAVALRLYRVVDQTAGILEAAGPEHRKGFAHRDELLREWREFYPTWDRYGFGLLAGWGDYYEWDRPGNYIDFALNPDGLYVLRLTADPGDGIFESNEQDNVSYSYIRVTETRVDHLESGRGTDPWDRCKILIPLGPEPEVNAPQEPRPEDCPPDTV